MHTVTRLSCIGVLIVMLTGVGCGDSATDRQRLSGDVIWNGQPLAAGSIRFVSVAKGPTSGGAIESGRFSLDAASGLPAGVYRVEIESWQPTGKKEPSIEDPSQMVDIMRQVIPKSYNEQSDLRAEVVANKENRFTFELTSK